MLKSLTSEKRILFAIETLWYNAASFSCQEIVFTKYNNRKRRTLLSHKILNKQPLLKLWTCQLLIYKPRGKMSMSGIL